MRQTVNTSMGDFEVADGIVEGEKFYLVWPAGTRGDARVGEGGLARLVSAEDADETEYAYVIGLAVIQAAFPQPAEAHGAVVA